MAILLRIIVHLCIIEVSPSFSSREQLYEIHNFDGQINSFPSSCHLSISYFGDFLVPPNIQRPYQISKYHMPGVSAQKDIDNADPIFGFSAESATDAVDTSPILIGNLSFSFVTCSSLSQGQLDYWGYVKPFQVPVWYALLGACLLLAILLFGQNYAKYRLGLSWNGLADAMFKSMLDLVLIAFEGTSPSLGVMFKSLASKKIITLWAMVTFVLVNTYKSIVTEETTAPLVSNPPKTFDQLMNGRFRIYSSPITESRPKFLTPQTMTRWRVREGEFDSEIYSRFAKWQIGLPAPLQEVADELFVQSYRMDEVMLDCSDDMRHYCTRFHSRLLKDNHSLFSQVKWGFKNIKAGRIEEVSQVLDSSLISDIVGQCDKTVFVAPANYVSSKGYLLSILGGDSSHINRK
ncbi:hypothetical protein Fcan01_16903, partial [Folsomia candida]